jgi:hypothetical protein
MMLFFEQQGCPAGAAQLARAAIRACQVWRAALAFSLTFVHPAELVGWLVGVRCIELAVSVRPD